jgi:TnpA family transposase
MIGEFPNLTGVLTRPIREENWNSTNEFICYGRQGEMATNSREQQEATTLSLQLLQNCLMLINTILI